MLSKCVNIACSARFLYLHTGKLFKLETSQPLHAAGNGSNRHSEHFWLCERCSQILTVAVEHGMVTTRPRRLLLPPAEAEVEEVVYQFGKNKDSMSFASIQKRAKNVMLCRSAGGDMKREFASLNAQEALHVAIFIEERNAEIYHQFAEMFAEFRDPESLEIAAAFWDMANEERRHGTQLQKRYFDRFGTRPCAVTEEDIRDFIEVPRLENGELFSISRLKVGRSPRQMALEIAMVAEQNAVRYYTKLSETTEDPELRAVYREFVDFEANHSDWLEKKVSEARRTSGGTKLA